MSGLGDWLQMEVLAGEVFRPHGACDWKATLASTFEKGAELWALIAAEMPSAGRRM